MTNNDIVAFMRRVAREAREGAESRISLDGQVTAFEIRAFIDGAVQLKLQQVAMKAQTKEP